MKSLALLVVIVLVACGESEPTKQPTDHSPPSAVQEQPPSPPMASATSEEEAPIPDSTAEAEESTSEVAGEPPEFSDEEVQAKLDALNAELQAKAEEASKPTKVVVDWVVVDLENRLVHRPSCRDVTSAMLPVRLDVMRSQGIPEHDGCKHLPTRKEEQTVIPRITMAGSQRASRPSTPSSTSPKSSRERESANDKKVIGAATEPSVDKDLLRAANNFFDVERKIAESCNRQWPGDADMAAHCYEKQLGAAQALDRMRPFGVDPEDFDRKRVKCYQSWGNDYQMRLYCEGKD